jgi:hypothetical protein
VEIHRLLQDGPRRNRCLGMAGTLYFLALISGGLYGASKDQPDMVVRATPRYALWNFGEGVQVTLVVEVVGREDEKFYCPELEIYWGDGDVKGRLSDCPPFEQRAEFPRRYVYTHRYLSPGMYVPRVIVRKGSRIIKRLEAETNLSFGS